MFQSIKHLSFRILPHDIQQPQPLPFAPLGQGCTLHDVATDPLLLRSKEIFAIANIQLGFCRNESYDSKVGNPNLWSH